MDTLASEQPPPLTAARPPKIWKFWGTALWGLFIFAAMFAGQLAVIAWFIRWVRTRGFAPFAIYRILLGGVLLLLLAKGWR